MTRIQTSVYLKILEVLQFVFCKMKGTSSTKYLSGVIQAKFDSKYPV